MAKQAFFVETIVSVADTLVDDFDVVDVLTMLSGRCAELLGVSAAAVLLASPEGKLTYLASSRHSTQEWDLFQGEVHEGPARVSLEEKRTVSWEIGEAQALWPVFAEHAFVAGFRSGHSLPMRLRNRAIGVLSIMRMEPGHMDENEFAMARGLADVAAITVITSEAANDAVRVNEQLSTALQSRIIIEQAKGMIAQSRNCDMLAAFAAIRSYSRNNNKQLTNVAREIVDGTLPLSEIPAGEDSRNDLGAK